MRMHLYFVMHKCLKMNQQGSQVASMFETSHSVLLLAAMRTSEASAKPPRQTNLPTAPTI